MSNPQSIDVNALAPEFNAEAEVTPTQPLTGSESLTPADLNPAGGQRHRRRLLGIGLLLLGMGGLIGLPRMFIKPPVNAPEIRHEPLSVATLSVEQVSQYSVRRRYTGEVAAVRSSELGFERAGQLIWIGADRGDRVAAGAAIARLDTRNLEAERQQLMAERAQAQARLSELQLGPRSEDIAAARSTVSNLENQLALERLRQDRREYLYETGVISREERDQVAFGAEALADQLAAARSRLDELLNGTRPEQIAAQQAAVDQLNAAIANLDVSLDKSILKAPFTGILAARHLDEGTVVGAGQSVVRLIEDTIPEVEVGIPETAIAQVQPGQQYPVSIGSVTYTGTVASILPEVDPASRTRTLVLTLESAATNLAPEQIVELAMEQTIAEVGYWLPLTALARGDRGLWSAYALTPAEADAYTLERREVEVLHTEGDSVFVRGTLQAGDVIVASGTPRLVPGQWVRPAEL